MGGVGISETVEGGLVWLDPQNRNWRSGDSSSKNAHAHEQTSRETGIPPSAGQWRTVQVDKALRLASRKEEVWDMGLRTNHEPSFHGSLHRGGYRERHGLQSHAFACIGRSFCFMVRRRGSILTLAIEQFPWALKPQTASITLIEDTFNESVVSNNSWEVLARS